MNTKHIALSLVIAAALASPHALATETPQDPPKKHRTLKAALKGGGMGCVIGGLMAKLMKADVKQGCLAAGVAGAIQAGVAEHKRQVEEARAFATEAKNAGIEAQVITKVVTVSKGSKSEATEGLDRLVLPLNSKDLANKSEPLRGVLVKAATLADASKVPVTIVVAGTKSQRGWMVGVLNGARSANSSTTIEELNSSRAQLTLTPVPVVQGNQS